MKKAIFLTILIAFMVSMSFASAAHDTNTTDNTVLKENEKIPVASTFTALNESINGNNNTSIDLSSNYTYDPETDGVFKNGIEINRELTVNGNGFTINAADHARIFKITSNNVTIKNITFTNAYGSDNEYGGAVYWKGDFGRVMDCSFINCRANALSGAVHWELSSDSIVSNCIFVNCSAVKYDGGAVTWYSSIRSVICECIFVDCSARYGAAIRCEGRNNQVRDCIFINNTAREGGIVEWGEVENGIVSACIFLNNTSNNGIVYFSNQYRGSNFTVKNSIFLNNEKGSEISFYKAENSSNVDFNWFGNNATDYKNTDSFLNATPEVWLFLNATTDRELFTRDIVFKLYSYNASSGEISEYNNDLLPLINLTLASNGKLNRQYVNLGESVTVTPVDYINCLVSAKIENAEYTIVFDAQIPTKITAAGVTATYNKNKNLVITLKDEKGNPISGAKMSVTLNGVKTYTTNAKGQISINVKKLVPKTYTAAIVFEGNAKYIKSKTASKIVVKKAAAKITAKKKTFKKSTKVKKYTIILKDNVRKAIKKAKVTLKIKGKIYRAKTNSKGKASFKIKKLTKKGKFKAVITYKGNKYYKKATKKVIIRVKSR